MLVIYLTALVKGFTLSILGIVAAYFLFQKEAGIISVFFATLGLYKTVDILFEINRQEIWEKKISPFIANQKTTLSLLSIFLGILLSYGIFVSCINQESTSILFARQLGPYQGSSIKDIQFGNFSAILNHNIAVYFIVFCFALIYRIGGLLLVIAWNASLWGIVFAYVIKMETAGLRTLLLALCILPHLFTEAMGYILASLSGLFLSKGMVKYKIFSDRQHRVFKAVIVIFLVGILTILLSAFLESRVTPKLLNLFTR